MTRKRMVIAVLVLLGVCLLSLLIHALLSIGELDHPLGLCVGHHPEVVRCRSYNLYSGSLSDVSELSLLAAILTSVLAAWHHINCIEPGCWRKGHRDPEHGHPVCAKHTHHDLSATRPHVMLRNEREAKQLE